MELALVHCLMQQVTCYKLLLFKLLLSGQCRRFG